MLVLHCLNITSPQRQLIYWELRNINAINRDDLKRDVTTIVNTQSELTAQQLNEKLHTLLDQHAPAMQCRMLAGRSSPW